MNLQILGDLPAGLTPVLRGSLDEKRVTLFFVEDGHLRGVIAINAARDLKLARKWMNQGRAVDVAALVDTSKALA